MIEHKMIRANINPDFEIKENDKNAYHFRWVVVKINPADPTHPIRKNEIRAIRKCDYRAYFDGKSTEELIRRMKIIGAEEVELIHDPTKPVKSEKITVETFSKVDAKEVTDEQKIKEGQAAEVKAIQNKQEAMANVAKEKASRSRSSKSKIVQS